MSARKRIVFQDNIELEPIYGTSNKNKEAEIKSWNAFDDPPRKKDSGSTADSTYFDLSVKVLKIITVIVIFFVVLSSAVISKGSMLFMVSQIKWNVTRPYCNEKLGKMLFFFKFFDKTENRLYFIKHFFLDKLSLILKNVLYGHDFKTMHFPDSHAQYAITLPEIERVIWIWLLIFAYFAPELQTFLRSLRICCFKSWEKPSTSDFFSLLFTEGCPAVGSALLIFLILPELDVIKGAMLTNAVCFVPAIITFFSRKPQYDYFRIALDLICVVAQASAFIVWPLLEGKPVLFCIPFSIFLISVGWWENYVSVQSPIAFIKRVANVKRDFKNGTYFLYLFISWIKCGLFLLTVLMIFWIRDGDYSFIFNHFDQIFDHHLINITEIEPIISISTSPLYQEAIKIADSTVINTETLTPWCIWGINVLSTYICYMFARFACKVMIQGFGFAFPLNLAVPVLLSILIAMCGSFLKNECAFSNLIPEYLFFNAPPLYFLKDFITHQHSYIWLAWLLSQTWITVHIWCTPVEKLAKTEKLFFRPLYDAFLIDQSLALNRRRHETTEEEDKTRNETDLFDVNDEAVTRIYACATMWHETREEMLEFLKSIFRMDEDQCAHRIVRNYMQYKLPNYYEFETHILFDDAFWRRHEKDLDPLLNKYVQTLISAIDDAATEVHGTQARIRPPVLYPTPYGGRMVWILPGRTKMIAHLKDRAKIRNKKRWSQVMYMYYLLGYNLMDNGNIAKSKKDKVAENTFLLALDGDIDFQPQAVHLLVDYMKKNKSLGAACGRIHPLGSGPIAWYQMFEYAVGHWLQKATEHVIGCVLCSPGCFSLFRGKALMDHSVMKKYTTRSKEAKDFVQYDQGEDRWLCTLLLQMGYRVEYSAASDAFTHCPEGFREFYNQRRRWMPSTMANILDLLMDYKHTIAINDNISKIYIIYQVVLMIGTVLGPGTIFLMLVGAFVTAFGMDQWTSMFWNLTPILTFILICATCKEDIQIFFAGVISAIYGLVMMAVFIGVMLQISVDGALAPTSLFFFIMIGEMVIAALMHPREFNCLKYGIIYYVTVPSMYMLLVIYSVFNMNNISWGTRDVTIMPEAPKKDETKDNENNPGESSNNKNKVLSFFGVNEKDNSGSIEFSLNKLFKCMFCTYRSDVEENVELAKIQMSIDNIIKKLEKIEQKQHVEVLEPRKTISKRPTINNLRQEQISEESDDENKNTMSAKSEVNTSPPDDIIENSWFYNGELFKSEVRFLDKREESFWNDLIKLYLHPIEDDKKEVSAKLKDLRDKMVFTFFMLNSLFVLVVFLLTLKKDILHVNWPYEPKVNFTYYNDLNEFHMYRTYLQLEPIGFVFLIFFGLLLVIQFIGMFFHRFGTYSQIISNTNIEFDLIEKNVENLTPEDILIRDPLKIARDLQQLKGINRDDEDEPLAPVDRRKTVNDLAQKTEHRNEGIYDLVKAFQSRLKNISEGNHGNDISDIRRKSVAWVNQRRQTIVRRQSNVPQAYDNKGFIFDDNEENDCEV